MKFKIRGLATRICTKRPMIHGVPIFLPSIFLLVTSGFLVQCYPGEYPGVEQAIETAVVDEETNFWLNWRAYGTEGKADKYYEAIGARPDKDTLDGFKKENNFDTSGEIVATYYNEADLRLGREMHCKQNGPNVACYVTNYGSPGGSASDAFEALNNGDVFATVAMEFTKEADNEAVQFYVYVPDQDNPEIQRLGNFAILDSEGGKEVPGLCLACHGGRYNPNTNKVEDAYFLPFDVFSFKYEDEEGKTLDDQQEAFRFFNFLVWVTVREANKPAPAITDLINGMYGQEQGVDRVIVAGTVPNNDYVPSGWNGHPEMYRRVVKPFCRSCHIALPGKDLNSYAQFLNYQTNPNYDPPRLEALLFEDYVMPHAEVPFRRFWDSEGATGRLLLCLESTGPNPDWPGLNVCKQNPDEQQKPGTPFLDPCLSGQIPPGGECP